MRSLCVFALFALNGALAAQAADFTVRGLGNQSCEQWVRYHQNVVTDDLIRGQAQLSWVLGYMTAVNEWVASPSTDLLGQADSKAIDQWISEYCRQSPREPILVAARNLLLALKKNPALPAK